MAKDSGSKEGNLPELRTVMKDASAVSEDARTRLQQAHQALAEVTHLMGQMGEVSASLQPVAEQLSDMTLDAARRMWGPIKSGESLVDLVGRLSEVARQVAVAFCDLETYIRQSAVSLREVIGSVQQSSDDLDRVIFSLRAGYSTPPPLPDAAAGSADKVVALQLKLNRSAADRKEAAERKPPSILDLWPSEPRGRDDLKN